MNERRRRWFDDAAGPVVRPYAVTRGRTRSGGGPLDLVSIVVGGVPSAADRMWLESEHLRLLARCRRPTTVVDLASDTDLPLGVVRVLLGDLRDRGLATVRAPAPSEYARDETVLRMVLDELHSL
ncbi:DUF742 domain-containing protein [Actinoallomurus iriomotensis]|uniref:DUF742 domain-containing protein n=1 Tax=Actinoallomurus iriomotensis TaxID=478107 RepID=A0A9W6R9K6_9ACTN|nr:DUF742 domain-containing protein [Actinoallomurus iriomotensis]GLY71776.1 hypothetical protein Airi01_000430 [Actinoallomurus iriomotensis]